MVGGLLGLEGGAQQARALEAAEPGLLLGDLAGHEGHAEQLAVGMLEAGAGLAPVVHDHLRVADRGPPGVVLQAIADGRHGHRRLGVVEVGPAGAVLGREHEDLVDAAAVRLREHRAEVVHLQRLVAVEGRVAVGDDPHHPLALFAVGLQRWGRGFLVAGAEGAGPVGVGLDREVGRDQVAGACGPVDGDHDPAPGEGIEAELAHCAPFGPRQWVGPASRRVGHRVAGSLALLAHCQRRGGRCRLSWCARRGAPRQRTAIRELSAYVETCTVSPR